MNNNNIVPNNYNLEIQEIESYLTTINNLITSAIDEVVPKLKRNNHNMPTNSIIKKIAQGKKPISHHN